MDQASIADAKAARQLSDIVRQAVDLKRNNGEWRGLCPFHREKTPSFYVNDQKQFYHCFGCGAHGDAIDFVMRLDGIGFNDAVAELVGKDLKLSRDMDVTRHHAVLSDREDEARKRKLAHEIWMKREPVSSIAHRYLIDTRGLYFGIKGPPEPPLGYVRECFSGKMKRAYPALIGAVQDRTGAVTAIQRIFLDPLTNDAVRDEKGKRHKATLGPMKDGCVRLAIPHQDTLGIAGSIEDALSAIRLFSLPVWATCGENRFSSVWIPEHITRVVIFADNDAAGLREAQKAASRIYGRNMVGRDRSSVEVQVQVPPAPHKDWNDVVRARA